MIWLLPVTWDDSADLLRWRNDPVTRANSRSTAEVSQEDHDAWMAACMAPDHPKGSVWVADCDGTSVGVVRISLECEVSITVAPEHRGKGHAKEMLRQACENAGPFALDAEIRITNTASQYVFEQCGFKMISSDGEFMQYRRIPK
jgi:RimJ/RimL family protein N-acetyltransferase